MLYVIEVRMIHLWLIASISLLPLLVIPTMLIRDWYMQNIVVKDTMLLTSVDRRHLLLYNIVEYTKDKQ